MTVKQKNNYDVGSIFCVPLRDGGYAIGVVARCDHRGLVFGYFFGPRMGSKPESYQSLNLKVDNAVLCGQFGDIGLKNGEWRLVGTIEQWNPEIWPMPAFCSPSDDEGMVTVTEYDDSTLDTKSVTKVLLSEVNAKLPVDRVMGYGAVEIILTKLLAIKRGS